MFEKEITQTYLCEMLKVSPTYLTSRMTGKKAFELDVVYKICDKLQIPYSEIPIFFPPNGVNDWWIKVGKEIDEKRLLEKED